MKPVWYKLSEVKPKKSGYYMFRRGKEIEICYYCQPIDYLLILEYDYYYCVSSDSYSFGNVFWAKMPKIPQSKILCGGTLKITF